MKQPEAKFKKKLRDGFKLAFGDLGVSYYEPAYLNVGKPDLVFIFKGQTLWVEAKWEANSLSKLQKIQRDRIVKAGGRWLLINGFEGGCIHIRDAEGELRQAHAGANPFYRTLFWEGLLIL